MYVCCADPGSAHWWIEVLEADEPEGFVATNARTVLPGDHLTGVKDPIVQRTNQGWQARICCHLLDRPGEEDRMNTAYATSEDGIRWEWHGVALEGRPGAWDARGARVTTVLPDGRAARRSRCLRRPSHCRRKLVRAHGPRVPGRRTRTAATRRRRARGRPVPRRPAAPGRWLSHLLRSQASRREPRTAHGDGPALKPDMGKTARPRSAAAVLDYWRASLIS